jgi:hypothetical protein
MIFYTLNSLVIGTLILDFLDRRFPNELKLFITNLSINALYYFGVFQISLFKMNNKVDEYIESNETIFKIKKQIEKQIVNFFNKNSDYYKTSLENSFEICDNYDFYIQNFINDDKSINKQICFKDGDAVINETSEIKFMLVELKIGDNIYKIDLKNKLFNYYLVGNKFTKNFFAYYLEKNNSDVEYLKQDFMLYIIDHNIKKVDIELKDNEGGFVIEKNDYKVI